MKKYTLSFTFLIILTVFSGCQKVPVDDESLASGLISKEGVKAEVFVSENVWMVFKLGTNDQVEKANLDKLSKHFPQQGLDLIISEMSSDFNEEFKDAGISFEEDLLPAIGEDAQVMMSFSGEVSDDKEPDLLVVAAVSDAAVFEEWMDEAVENGNGEMQDYKDFPIFSGPEKNTFVTQHRDVILVSNSLRHMKDSLDRGRNGLGSLLANPAYQKSLKNASVAFAYFYINPAYVLDNMKDDPELREKLGDEFRDSELFEMTGAIEAEFFAFMAEPEGIRIVGNVFFDESKLGKFKDIFNMSTEPAYLYKTLPGNDMMVYSESSNFKESVGMLMGMYSSFDDFNDGMSVIRESLMAGGIDFDEDLLAIMDKGYAFVLNDLDMIVPGLGVYIDSSSKPDSAKKIMFKISDGFSAFEKELLDNQEVVVSQVITNESYDNENALGFEFAMDFSKMSDEDAGDMPEDLRNARIEFNYGVDANNLAYFTLYPDFEKGDFSALADNENFKKDMVFVEGYDRSLSYIDVESVMRYVDRVVEFGAKMEGVSSSEYTEYQLVKSYLSPIKSLVFSAKEPSDGGVEMSGFIRIGL